MNDAATQARVILADALELEPGEIADDASIDNVDSWNSLAHMRLVLAIEAALGHEIEPDALFEIAALKDVAVMLESANGGANNDSGKQ